MASWLPGRDLVVEGVAGQLSLWQLGSRAEEQGQRGRGDPRPYLHDPLGTREPNLLGIP